MKFARPVSALTVGLLLGFSVPCAIGQTLPPVNSIMFDPDGSGGQNGAIEVGSFDWNVSSSLVVPGNGTPNAIPITDLTQPTSFNILAHAQLRGFVKPDGNPAPAPTGLNSKFEITFVAGTCTLASPSGSVTIGGITSASTLNLALDPACGAIANPGEQQFFEIWYDNLEDGNGLLSDSLSGAGYRDGRLIMRGSPVAFTGNSGIAPIAPVPFDQYLGDNYGGKLTVVFEGSQSVEVLITHLDKTFFTDKVNTGSLASFTSQARLPFRETNPSLMFYSTATTLSVGSIAALAPDNTAELGAVNALSGTELESQADASHAYRSIPPGLACRVTGGGNDTAGISALGGWDGTKALDSLMSAPIAKGKGKSQVLTTREFVYTFGGQAGANTAQQPQPKGQWEHQNHDGPDGLQFNFKIGTSAAPKGTKIDAIACTDEGWCRQARPAPNKQIDFVGTGSFTSMSNNTDDAVDNQHTFAGIKDVVPVPSGKRDKDAIPTYHWFQVHIEDLGEPGSQENEDGATCPTGGSGNNPFADPPIITNIADCGCADFYRIRIYKGFIPVLDENDNITNTGDIKKADEDVIYEVWGYINGGNFQIHPPTGFDLK